MRVVMLVLVIVLCGAASAQAQEATEPALLPTETPTPTITPTPTPAIVVYATVQAAGDETGQATAFVYQMDAGQVVTNTLLAGILFAQLLTLVVILWRGSRWNK